jgi:MFS family permease
MSLYMMVFAGGTPLGGPLIGWVTEAYGPRVGLLVCGLVSAAAAVVVGAVLARSARLRLSVRLRGGRPVVAFVPRISAPEPDADLTSAA